MKTLLRQKTLALALAASIAMPVLATDLADIPMAVNNLVAPNIMFMLDNSGSMHNIVVDSPYSTTGTYLASCPTTNASGTNVVAGGEATAALAIDSAAVVDIRNDNGTVYMRRSGTAPAGDNIASNANSSYGSADTKRCFDNAKYYKARLKASSCSGNVCSPGNYLSAVYSGHFLNWYFGDSSTSYASSPSWAVSAAQKSGTNDRMTVVKDASKDILDSLSNVRVGLSTYSSPSGGSCSSSFNEGCFQPALILSNIDSISTNLSTVKTKVDALAPTGVTPLSETLASLGRYFIQGNEGETLTLHPGAANQETATASNVLTNQPLYDTGLSAPTGVIQYSCQRNFVVLMTDGRPQADQALVANTYLADYDGDCVSASPACNTYDRKTTQSYESAGSDYLDDVAKMLFEVDLRPNLHNADGTTVKNNIYTYTIGFADATVQNDPLLSRTASQGGGLNLFATGASDLASAFRSVTDDILSKDGSAAAVAVANANVTSGDNASYVSSYNSGTWTGDLIAYPIDVSTGIPDLNSPIWNSGCTDTSAWVDASDTSKGRKSCSAQVKLDAVTASSRKIVTLKDEGGTRTPVQFQPTTATTTTKLSTTQQNLLNSTTTPPGTTDGANVASFLHGVSTLEGVDYRTRVHKLGDLVNSEPVVQREPSFSYADSCSSTAVTTGAASGQCSTPYKTAKASRQRMVYIGGNDGLLHAFNADTGTEEWAYVPRFVMSNMNNLSKKTGFTHKYYVDGTAVIGDANFKNTSSDPSANQDWRTILVGGLGKGGRGYYALDVTCPTGTTVSTASACGTSLTEDQLTAKVLWEFPSSDTTHASHVVNVGNTYGKPIITKLADYGWVVLVTSGYNNGTDTGGTGRGYLWVLDAKTGAVLQTFDTGVGTSADPSGLAHIAAWTDNGDLDNTATYIYGGDLKGNVWRFTPQDSGNPGIVYPAPRKLAVLKDAASTPVVQPITTVPELAEVAISSSSNKRFVYVGTGQYLGNTDVATSQKQTIYGLVDDLSTAASPVIPEATRSNLQQQTLTTSGSNRTVTTNSVDFTTKKGWYVDLPGCNTVTSGSCTAGSERINADPAIALGALIFTSNIPSATTCVPGGSSWLNYLDTKTGGTIQNSTSAYSGTYLGNALASRPVLIKLPSGEVKALVRKSDATTVSTGVPVPSSGGTNRRISWREVTD